MDYNEIISKKILNEQALMQQLSVWRLQNQSIVFTNGCFDILHLGHTQYLSQAKNYGDKLILGLNSDKSGACKKGEGRPVNNETARAFVLASLHVVDAVVLFDEETPYNLIKLVQPDVLVKGADYEIEKIVGYDIVIQRGGKVVTIDLTQEYSTTALLKRINNKNF